MKKLVGEIMNDVCRSSFDFVQTSPCGRGEHHPHGKVDKFWIINNPETIRIGNCFLKGRLKKGDVFLCVGHSGDYFQKYIFVDGYRYSSHLTGHPEWCFGSYGIGDSIEADINFTKQQIQEIKEGKSVIQM